MNSWLDDWEPVRKQAREAASEQKAYKVMQQKKGMILVLSQSAYTYLGDFVELFFNDMEGQVAFLSSTEKKPNAYKLLASGRVTTRSFGVPVQLRSKMKDCDWLPLEEKELGYKRLLVGQYARER